MPEIVRAFNMSVDLGKGDKGWANPFIYEKDGVLWLRNC